MKRIAPITVGVAAVVLTAGACGGSAKTAGGSASSTTAGQPATSAPSTAGPTSGPEVNPSGDIPDNRAFVAYSPPSGGFSVKIPEGWARVEAGEAVTFTDKLNSIRMETVVAAAAPTIQSAQQNEVPKIQAAVANFKAGEVTSVTRKAGAAVLITYGADSAPDPVTGKVVYDAVERYEFWKAGTEVVLTLSGPQGADNVDPWRIVTDSFGWQ